MNILYISSKKSWRGVVTWMQKTALGLESKGHKVWILTHKKSALAKKGDKKLNLIKENLGFDYNPFKILRLILFVKKNKIDLIVTNIEKEISIGGIVAKVCGIPNIRRVGREDDFFKRTRTKFNHKYLVDYSIVPCNYVSTQIKKENSWIDIDKFKTIYNGRDIKEYTDAEKKGEKERLGLPLDKKIIGITTHLHKIKYVNHLIEAFSRLDKKYSEWILVIAGDGTEMINLKNQAKDCNISDKCFFTSFTNTPMLTSSIYDISVLTSKLEGFANSIVEYMAVGSAIIATDVGGAKEIIEDGKNGFLIPFGDIDKLVERLTELIKKPNLRQEFKNKGLVKIRLIFTEKDMIDNLEKFFMEQIA